MPDAGREGPKTQAARNTHGAHNSGSLTTFYCSSKAYYLVDYEDLIAQRLKFIQEGSLLLSS